jgi:hypothetical protein
MFFTPAAPVPSLADPTSATHPLREPALHLCRRQTPGTADFVLAQSGAHHISYQVAGLREAVLETGIAPRFPEMFLAECGRAHCIAIFGTTLVVHAWSNNSVRIGTLVPDPKQPAQATARFAMKAKAAVPASTHAYPSLCVSITALHCLLPSGVLLTSRPAKRAAV